MTRWSSVLILTSVAAVLVVIWKRRRIMVFIRGYETDSPESLAVTAGYDTDVYSLARVGESEETGLGSIACMWATKNWAKRRNESVTKLVTTVRDKQGNTLEGDGHYGKQLHRYCSTAETPSQQMLENAAGVMSGSIDDPTNGAHHWDAPHLQDKLHAEDPDNHPSSEEIASRREAAGWHMVLVDGVTKTRYWR